METADIAWLAGVIDGEGCLSLATRSTAKGYWPVLFIYNSSLRMIEKSERVIQSLGATPTRMKTRSPKNGLSRRNLEGLHVNRGLPLVLQAVLPHLASDKKEFAEALLRLDAMRTPYSTWTAEQLALAVAIRAEYMPRSDS